MTMRQTICAPKLHRCEAPERHTLRHDAITGGVPGLARFYLVSMAERLSEPLAMP